MHPTDVGVVSFVNTLPLIDGLERLAELRLRHSVPSLLVDQLCSGEVDLALCSSIDYQLAPQPLLLVPAGALGCCGPTLTVRLYSQTPIDQVQRVYCDTDSHTSIVLMQILLREVYDKDVELVEYNAREHVACHRPVDWPETMLLIGDKVVTDSPPAIRYPTQLDLGDLWHRHTGLPFVFAVWMTRRDHSDPRRIVTAARILDRQRRHNIERLDGMIRRGAVPRGWPPDLAATYLKRHLRFDWGDEQRRAMETFFARAAAHGILDDLRPLESLDWEAAVV